MCQTCHNNHLNRRETEIPFIQIVILKKGELFFNFLILET